MRITPDSTVMVLAPEGDRATYWLGKVIAVDSGQQLVDLQWYAVAEGTVADAASEDRGWRLSAGRDRVHMAAVQAQVTLTNKERSRKRRLKTKASKLTFTFWVQKITLRRRLDNESSDSE
jgi:hypothetical protein